MSAKEYLQQLRRFDLLINQKIQELSELRMTAESLPGMKYSEDKVQKSLSQNAPFISSVHRIIELEKEIDAEIDRFVDEKHRIINQIQGLSDMQHIEVLFKRYVEYKSLETISEEMGYTPQYVREIHGQALEKFQETYINQQNPTKVC